MLHSDLKQVLTNEVTVLRGVCGSFNELFRLLAVDGT